MVKCTRNERNHISGHSSDQISNVAVHMEWAQSIKRTDMWTTAEQAKERTGNGRTQTTVVSSIVVRLKQQTWCDGGAVAVQTCKRDRDMIGHP